MAGPFMAEEKSRFMDVRIKKICETSSATEDCRADLAIYSAPLGHDGFPTVRSYVNVGL